MDYEIKNLEKKLDSVKERKEECEKRINNLESGANWIGGLILGIVFGILGSLLSTMVYEDLIKPFVWARIVIGIILTLIIIYIIFSGISLVKKINRDKEDLENNMLLKYKELEELIKERIELTKENKKLKQKLKKRSNL